MANIKDLVNIYIFKTKSCSTCNDNRKNISSYQINEWLLCVLVREMNIWIEMGYIMDSFLPLAQNSVEYICVCYDNHLLKQITVLN